MMNNTMKLIDNKIANRINSVGCLREIKQLLIRINLI